MREKVDMVGALIRAGFDAVSAAAAVGLPPMTYLPVQPITVRPVDMLDAQTEQAAATAAAAAANADATAAADAAPAKATDQQSLAESLALEAFRASSAVSRGVPDDEPSTVSDREG